MRVRASRVPPRRVTTEAREKFLVELAGGATVSAAAALAGHDRRRMYELRADDAEFEAAWSEAIAAGTEKLEAYAIEFATVGVLVEVRDGDGKLVRTERRPDPTMVRFLLAARKPDVYSERARVEVTGANGGPVELAADFRQTTIADVVRLARDLGIVDAIDGEVVDEDDGPLELPEASS